MAASVAAARRRETDLEEGRGGESEGSDERVGDGIAWRPYPLPASAWQRGEGRPVRRERTGAPRSAVQGKEATDGVRWAGWVGVGRGLGGAMGLWPFFICFVFFL